MRCPDCNKFVSYEDDPEVEVISESINHGEVSIEVEITLNCGECGERLKETTQEFNKDYKCPECGSPEIELDSVEVTGMSRVETKGKNGKEIKSPRGWRTYYGADLEIGLTCESCEHSWVELGNVEEQASNFDECC